MNKTYTIAKILTLGVLLFLCSGCKRDDMEDITIMTTNYPNEFVIEQLYKEHATTMRVYPDGIDTEKYKITNKQKKDYANKDLFIYTGLIDRERDLAISLLDYNNDLKIIDSSYVLENEYQTEEIWTDPSFMLMMSQNVRIGLKEYIENTYLKKEIDENYENLKVSISELDANIRLAVESAPHKVILAADKTFKYLEKYGLTVYLLNDETSEKDKKAIEELVENGTITKIFTYENNKITSNVQNLVNQFPNQLSYAYYQHLNIITEEQRAAKSNYISLMNQNLDVLKEEIYHGTDTTIE